jgi:hypothetical protein
MGIPIASNFDLSSGLPLDSRTIVDTRVNRDLIPAIQRFEGLSVFVTNENTTYQLHNGITNADWVALVVGSAPTLFDVTNTGNETIQPIVFGTEDGTVQKQIGIGDIATAGFYQLNLPNDNNTLVTTVNGVAADANGNIEIGPGGSPITIVNGNSLFSTGLTDTGTDSIATNSNFFGVGAGFLAIDASDSNFIGVNAGDQATQAERSNFLGKQAGQYAANAEESNFIGNRAGYDATFANNSNFIGDEAGYYATGAATFSEGDTITAGNGATSEYVDGTTIKWLFGDWTSVTEVSANNGEIITVSDGTCTGYIAVNITYPTTSPFTVGELLISDNGATGTYVSDTEVFPLTGDWAASTTVTGQTSVIVADITTDAYITITFTDIRYEQFNSNFIGTNAGSYASAATNSNFIGRNAGYQATNANNSNFFGQKSGSDAVNAERSNFIGTEAGFEATYGNASNFIGYRVGYQATNAERSNFLGYQAGYQASNASASNFIGIAAGRAATNANSSNFIGINAGYGATNAASSIFIGNGAGLNDTIDNTTNNLTSILIGSNTNTGGFSNSILLGSGANGSPIANTKENQFMLADTITDVRWSGVEYTLPSSQAANTGDVLSNDGAGVLSWVASGGGGAPTLQQVTDSGKATTQNIELLASQLNFIDNNGGIKIISGNSLNGSLNFGVFLLPDVGGVIPISVNGQTADVNGNIEIEAVGGEQDNIMRVVQVTLAEIGMTISDTDEDIKQALANYIEGSVIPEDEIWYFQITDYPGGATIFVEINLTNLLTLVTSNTLIPGAVYKITGVDSNLYGGTTIFLKALSTNTLEKSGHGLFYNPKYDQALTTDGIWDNISTFVPSSVVGTFGPNEIITADNGATGVIYSTISSNKFVVLTGDWLTATSITGNDTLATANIASVVLKTYSIDDNVIWGGKHWTNIYGSVGTATNALNLSEDWAVIPYDDVNYNVVYDPIEYDLATDIILKRTDSFGNEVEATANDRAYFTSQSYVGSPINVFQWGNQYVSSTNRGTGSNKINSGYAESVNNIGSFFANEVKSRSVIQGNATFTSKINLNRLTDFSQIRANVLNNGVLTGNYLHQGSTVNPFSASTINSNTLNSGEIKENLLRIKCTINNNTLTSSFIFVNNLFWSNINFNVMSNSAAIFSNNLDYLCTINSNTMSAPVQIVSNIMNRSSVINSNIMSATNTFIGTNQMYSNATIASNTLSGASASIFQNNLNVCYIQNNVLSGNFADIHSNTLLFPEPRVALSVRSSIQNNTLSITNAKIQSCLLKYNARIQNVTISTDNVRVRSLTIDDEYVDLNNVPLLRNYQYNEIGIKQRFFIFDVVFNGAAGSGLIGSIALPNYPIAAGFYIDSLEVDVNTGLTGVGGIINLGIGTDAPQSGLNDTTGDIATLNSAGITRIQNTTFTKATVLRNIVMEVKGANITAGTLSVRVNLKKF